MFERAPSQQLAKGLADARHTPMTTLLDASDDDVKGKVRCALSFFCVRLRVTWSWAQAPFMCGVYDAQQIT